MTYELECKTCGVNLATVHQILSRSFENSCHVAVCDVPTWNSKLEFISDPSVLPFKVRCYNCGQIHQIFKIDCKYVRRRVNN